MSEGTEGLRVELLPAGRRIRAVRIRGRAGGIARRALTGQPLTEVPGRAAQLFSVCRSGHRQAALAACEGALGQSPAVGQRALRSLLTEAEAARDWAMRIFLDGPRLMGMEPPEPEGLKAMVEPLGQLPTVLNPEGTTQAMGGGPLPTGAAPSVAELSRGLESALEPLFATQKGGDLTDVTSPEQFSRWARSEPPAGVVPAQILRNGWGGQGAHDQGLMADLSAEGLAELLDGERGEDFTQRPYWQAFQPEVGPLARFADHPVVAALTRAQGPALLARWAARLVALRTLPRRMEALAGLLEDGTPDPPAVPGLGRAEVARGPLWHWAAAEGGEHAVRYRILAPTEWNFHPDGPVAHALMGLEAFKRGEGLERAEVLVASFDPCVAFAVGWAGGE